MTLLVSTTGGWQSVHQLLEQGHTQHSLPTDSDHPHDSSRCPTCHLLAQAAWAVLPGCPTASFPMEPTGVIEYRSEHHPDFVQHLPSGPRAPPQA